ncbi:hypothetical protein WJX73_007217 [Symbiochloris irregularis]|uniref:Amino acid transporter transmembrane domain-containing protein n=1 Tax=Symbiochloris irregularis TaxID=706552 RepID=A0AAW1NVE4_9CHLO
MAREQPEDNSSLLRDNLSRESSAGSGQLLVVNSGPQRDSNAGTSVIILAKAIVGAGIAALPLTASLLGWPLSTLFLLGMAYATYYTLVTIIRFSTREGTPSYAEVVHKLLGKAAGIMLEFAIMAFGLGLMLVYEVVAGDMLVGKPGFKGILCQYLGQVEHCHWACNRTIVTGLVTLVVLVPLASFRRMESSAVASWMGMTALAVWATSTAILVVAGAFQGLLHPPSLAPHRSLLGGSGWNVATNVLAIIPIFTTAFSVQATAPFVLAELRPQTPAAKSRVSFWALVLTSCLFLLITMGSYAVFGTDVQSDVLHNFTPKELRPFLGKDLGTGLYIAVRLSFLVSVLSLYPIMMFPARDGLLRLTTGRESPSLSNTQFYSVTYAIIAALYLISVVTPSIWGPIQIIGATAGAVIGFIAPGMLALLPTEASLMPQHKSSRWRRAPGYSLIAIGVLQGIAGIASQLLPNKSV